MTTPVRPGVRVGTIMIAFVSGVCALAAFVIGSPLQFGLALALCGACWIAADITDVGRS